MPPQVWNMPAPWSRPNSAMTTWKKSEVRQAQEHVEAPHLGLPAEHVQHARYVRHHVDGGRGWCRCAMLGIPGGAAAHVEVDGIPLRERRLLRPLVEAAGLAVEVADITRRQRLPCVLELLAGAYLLDVVRRALGLRLEDERLLVGEGVLLGRDGDPAQVVVRPQGVRLDVVLLEDLAVVRVVRVHVVLHVLEQLGERVLPLLLQGATSKR